jgi:DNA-binding IclR family transcriptional regulator
MTLTEIAAKIDSPISSCHSLIRTLQARGYLYFLSSRRRCYPTRRLLEIASAIASHDPIVEKLRPVLEELRDATGETVILGKRHGHQVIYLDVVEGRQTIRYNAHPGETKPLHSSAIGKAMLSVMPAAELETFLKGERLERITDATITDEAGLRREIAAGRKRGYFLTSGENVVDVSGLAVLHRIDGEPVAIALAGPVSRFQRNKTKYLAALDEALGREAARPAS